jgi:hypothetical protein
MMNVCSEKTHSRIIATRKRAAEVGYLLAVFFMNFVPPAFAQSKITTIIENITAVLGRVITVVFMLAVIAFGWGIVKLIVAAGDPNEIKNAKGIIVWSVISIAVLASVAGIILYIQQFFGIDPNQTNISPPQFTP